MNSTGGNLKDALYNVATHKDLTLAACHGACGYQFSVLSLTSVNRMKRKCGIGEVAPRRVAQALLDRKSELMSIAGQWWKENRKDVLVLADRVITQIFIAAKIPDKAIDLFEGRYENWMKDLPLGLKNRKINQISFPSTHDSGSHKIDWKHPITDNTVNTLCRLIPFVRHIINSWTLTQQFDIGMQLRKGYRFFDLRISYDETEKKFCLSHTFSCKPSLEHSLTAIKSFLKEHPSEIVVLIMKPDWENRDGFYPHIQEFKEFVENELQELLYPPPQNLELPTYNNMVMENKNIITIWNDSANINSSLVWGPSTFQGNWCNSSDLQTTIDYLENLLKKVPAQSDSFFDFSITMTPQTNDVVISVLERIFMPWMKPRSLETLTCSIQEASQMFFNDPDYRDKLKKISHIPTDLPYHAFVHQVVELNYQKVLTSGTTNLRVVPNQPNNSGR